MSVMLVAFCLILWVSTTSAQEEQPGLDAESHLLSARELFHIGRFQEAMRESRQAEVASLTQVDLLLTKGEIAEFMGEFQEAQEAYGKANSMAPAHPAVLYRIASLAARSGQYEDALRFLDRIIASPEKGAIEQIIQLKIDIYIEQGDLATARKLAWEYGIVKANENYCEESRKRMNRGSKESAPKYFRLTSLAQPNEADCIWWYGQWLTDVGFVRSAKVMVKEAINATPSPGNKANAENYLKVRLSGGREISKKVEQLTLIGRLRYLREDDVEGAVRLFEEAIRLDPTFVRPYNHLATMAFERGNHEAAIRWLEKAIQVDPNSWSSHRTLGRALLGLGRYAEAEVHLKKAIELFAFTDDVGSLLALGRVLYAQGKFDEYVKRTRRALSLAQSWGSKLPGVSEFLERFEKQGRSSSLPSAPDVTLLFGWKPE